MEFEFVEQQPIYEPTRIESQPIFPRWLIWLGIAFILFWFLYQEKDVNPIDPDFEEGKYVLIVEDASQEGRNRLSETQQAIFRSIEVRETAEKLVSKIDGTPGFFICDKDSSMEYMPDIFDAMLRKANEEGDIPCVVIANEGRGRVTPLPESPERTIQLLKDELE